MREAIRFHIEGLLEDGLPVPEAESRLAYAGREGGRGRGGERLA